MSNDSDTTTHTRTLHAVPEPEPLTGLTGAPAAVYTELAGLTEPATAAELALAAGLGRSTTSKALTTLEQHGLAIRQPGGHNGALRTPDHWSCVQTAPTSSADTESVDEAEPSAGEMETARALPHPAARTAPEADEGAPTTADSLAQEPAVGSVPETSSEPDEAPMDSASVVERDEPAAQQLTPAPGQKVRLAPGGLRQMVIDHLTAHPDEAFTATRISRVIEKSSGAIANCLATLAKQQTVKQVGDTPRTYQLTAPTADTE